MAIALSVSLLIMATGGSMLIARSTALVALLTASVASALPVSVVEQAKRFPNEVLVAHNQERQAVGVTPLAWDEQLGRDAARYAVILALSNQIFHSDPRSRQNQGENLWMGTHGAFTTPAMVSGWTSERRLFVPGRFPSVSRSGVWHDVGHYTQMVWPTTRKIGCALASNRENDFLVCRYFPAGNVIGEMATALRSRYELQSTHPAPSKAQPD